MAPCWRVDPPSDPKAPRPTLFLDRDGVLIRDCDYLADPQLIEIIPGVATALSLARAAGYVLIGVSNQSGLGREYFTQEQFEAVMHRLDEMMDDEGVRLDGFYYCPHAPGADCACRKPNPGLLDEAAQNFCWSPERSWVIGDKTSDVQLGRQAGLGSYLVRTGYGGEQEPKVRERFAADERVRFADDLDAAVREILEADSLGQGS